MSAAASHFQYSADRRLEFLSGHLGLLEAQRGSGEAVVPDFEAARAIGLQVVQLVKTWPGAIDGRFQLQSIR